MSTPALLTVKDLVVQYAGRGWRAKPTQVLHGVSADLYAGKTLGLVGESGSGKTTLGRAIVGLVAPTSGIIEFDGAPISRRTRADQKRLSSEIQVVFQDPYSSLNPSMTVADILSEPLIANGQDKASARRKVRELLDHVGLPADASDRLPREFSGGQRQRVAIARALAVDPKVIVCDEPVSALDLSTQLRILDLLIDIQRETDVSYLFITHDIGAVRYISHDVSVMYRGEILESGPVDQVIEDPSHDYTKKLMLAAPVADPVQQSQRRRLRREIAATSGLPASP
ncbi:ATP-binding cassette domain-containing protein [Microbacterium sp. ZXX196]|uniref:ATP-binding cassette domain-containing protein n=1 Tax=Microbacterium sp. ZXX196 TaxID=2609291 RepID=UPI0012B763BD|nr:ATP-binding cassette domain-containing protein [Microbacterium sp. ZXX196]MTE24899.1 ATP-binding cassette domain-containing protein [Microbacterium sp. ZXX196]